MTRMLAVGRRIAAAVGGVPLLDVVSIDDASDLNGGEGPMDVAVVEERFGEVRSSIDAIRRVYGEALPVIAAVNDGDPAKMLSAMQAGAVGVINSPVDPQELSDAIDVVLAGGSYLGREATQGMVSALGLAPPPPKDQELTQREQEVLKMLGEGLSARQVAKRLGLSERTINTHVANVYRKLGVSNRVEAVREGIRLRIVPPP